MPQSDRLAGRREAIDPKTSSLREALDPPKAPSREPMDTTQARAEAVRLLNDRPQRVAISLLRSQTTDLFAASVPPALRERLESLRDRAPDRTKVAVDAILRDQGRLLITLDAASGETLEIEEAAVGGLRPTLGGGLCNLAKDMEIILEVLGDGRSDLPKLSFLSWADAAKEFGAEAVPGRSRTSLIFKDTGFDKLILTERGPTWDREDVDPWLAELSFYGEETSVLFIGQEPPDSRKFDYVRRRKLKNPALRVFWLVGGNQLKKLYTEYRNFLSIVDVVSLNLAEAAEFFAFEPLGPRHKNANELRNMYAREISRRTLHYGANHVVITDGARGASLARKARGGKVEFVFSPLIHENSIAVDPGLREDTGCGDGFAAAIGAYFLASPDGFKLNEAANFAHLIAGIIYQRPRPNLSRRDLGFVEYAYTKAQEGSAFVGKHETFDRNTCQIRPAEITPRGKRRHVLVLLLGDDPSDPGQPDITGAGAALERLSQLCRSGEYRLAPLVRVAERLTTDAAGRGRAGVRVLDRREFGQLVEQGLLCKELGSPTGPRPNGVAKSEMEGFEGVTLLRVTLLEALEILSSEDFAARFEDVKFWQFATENVDERLVWHARRFGLTPRQTEEVHRQFLRDYILRELGPQYRFAHARATNAQEFEHEMAEQLISRLDALLAGLFRERGA